MPFLRSLGRGTSLKQQHQLQFQAVSPKVWTGKLYAPGLLTQVLQQYTPTDAVKLAIEQDIPRLDDTEWKTCWNLYG